MKTSRTFFSLAVLTVAVVMLAAIFSCTPDETEELKELRENNGKLSQRYFEAVFQQTQFEKQRDDALKEVDKLQNVGVDLQNEKHDLQVQVNGRVVDLPDDAENLHTILFLQPDWEKRPNEQRAKQLFDSEAWCRDLRARTHWHVWTIDLPEAKPYWKFVTKTPCLMILDCAGEAGRVIYSEANPDLAKKPDSLLRQINVTRKRQKHGNQQPFNCPDGVCPIPKKEESQAINPPPQNVVAPPKEEPAKEEAKAVAPPADKTIPTGVALAIAAVVGLAGYVAFTLFGKTERIAKAYRASR